MPKLALVPTQWVMGIYPGVKVAWVWWTLPCIASFYNVWNCNLCSPHMPHRMHRYNFTFFNFHVYYVRFVRIPQSASTCIIYWTLFKYHRSCHYTVVLQMKCITKSGKRLHGLPMLHSIFISYKPSISIQMI